MLASMNEDDQQDFEFLRQRQERATSGPRTTTQAFLTGTPEGYRCSTNADCEAPLQCVLDQYSRIIRDQNQKGICRKVTGGRRRRTKRRRTKRRRRRKTRRRKTQRRKRHRSKTRRKKHRQRGGG